MCELLALLFEFQLQNSIGSSRGLPRILWKLPQNFANNFSCYPVGFRKGDPYSLLAAELHSHCSRTKTVKVDRFTAGPRTGWRDEHISWWPGAVPPPSSSPVVALTRLLTGTAALCWCCRLICSLQSHHPHAACWWLQTHVMQYKRWNPHSMLSNF